MSYAIIEVGGRQYRVEKGDSVVVDRLEVKEGAKIAPRALLYRSDKTLLEGPELAKVKVDAVVVEHLRGPKVRIFKYRPKKRYRRRGGHRSALTRLEIKGISAPAAGQAPAKRAAKPATSAAAKPATRAGAPRQAAKKKGSARGAEATKRPARRSSAKSSEKED
jgi:large subunit ribosomal protein L21